MSRHVGCVVRQEALIGVMRPCSLCSLHCGPFAAAELFREAVVRTTTADGGGRLKQGVFNVNVNIICGGGHLHLCSNNAFLHLLLVVLTLIMMHWGSIIDAGTWGSTWPRKAARWV